MQHGLNDTPKFIAEVRWDAIVVPLLDFQSERQLVLCLERRPQRCHLIRHTPQGPDVAFLVVVLFVDLLGAHVVRRAHIGLRVH